MLEKKISFLLSITIFLQQYESFQTVDWVSKLETQLYPILKTEPLTVERHISEVENKFNNILPEVKRAQDEIETRVKTAEELIGKGLMIVYLKFMQNKLLN